MATSSKPIPIGHLCSCSDRMWPLLQDMKNKLQNKR